MYAFILYIIYIYIYIYIYIHIHINTHTNVHIANFIMNKRKVPSLIVPFSVHYSPTNESLPDNSSDQESFMEVQEEV